MIYVSSNRPQYFSGLRRVYPEVQFIEDQYDLDGKVSRVNNQERLLQFKLGQLLYDQILKDGDIMIFDGPLGYRCLTYLDEIGKFHFGLRNFDYGTILKLDVFTHDGVKYVFLDKDKVYNDFPKKYEKLLSGHYFDFKYKFEVPKHEVFTLDQIDDFCKIVNSLEGDLAMDYESFGFPDYDDFKVTGASVSSKTRSLYLDFRYFKSPEVEKDAIEKWCQLMIDNCERVWVFNKAFESFATYRMCKKFVDFLDLMALGVCDEYRGGLKVMSQQYLRVGSWDDFQELLAEKYDWLSSKFKSYQELVDYTKKEGFGESEDDQKIKDIIKELRSFNQDFGILKKYWYGSFACTPIEIVSKYCCMDSFYTLMIKEVIQKMHPNYLQGI